MAEEVKQSVDTAIQPIQRSLLHTEQDLMRSLRKTAAEYFKKAYLNLQSCFMSSKKLVARDGPTNSVRSQLGLTKDEAQQLIAFARENDIQTALIPASEKGEPIGKAINRFNQTRFALNHIRYEEHSRKAIEAATKFFEGYHLKKKAYYEQLIDAGKTEDSPEYFIIQYNVRHSEVVLPKIQHLEQDRLKAKVADPSLAHSMEIESPQLFTEMSNLDIDPDRNYGSMAIKELGNMICLTVSKEDFLKHADDLHAYCDKFSAAESDPEHMELIYPKEDQAKIIQVLGLREEETQFVEYGKNGCPEVGELMDARTMPIKELEKKRKFLKDLDYMVIKDSMESDYCVVYMPAESLKAMEEQSKKEEARLQEQKKQQEKLPGLDGKDTGRAATQSKSDVPSKSLKAVSDMDVEEIEKW